MLDLDLENRVDPALIAASDLLLLTGAAVVAVVVVAILRIIGVTH